MNVRLLMEVGSAVAERPRCCRVLLVRFYRIFPESCLSFSL